MSMVDSEFWRSKMSNLEWLCRLGTQAALKDQAIAVVVLRLARLQQLHL